MASERSPLAVVAVRDGAVSASLELLLSTHGFEVATYASCEAVLGDPAATRAIWLFADSELTDGSGKALAGWLQEKGWAGTPVLMVEHDAPDADPGVLTLEKPFVAETLIAVLRSKASRREQA